MFLDKLSRKFSKVQNHLCLGLDPDIEKLPQNITPSLVGIEEFLERSIKASSGFCLAYKPNIAFFEALGIEGLRLLEKVIKWIPDDTPIIIDAKRGDVSHTSKQIARYIFDYFGADATTLHPYMGKDSLIPFFKYKHAYNFVLALTSNPSANDFETKKMATGFTLYESVIQSVLEWKKTYPNIGVVVGGTNMTLLSKIRQIDPCLLFLIPGIGAQGGNYQQNLELGKNNQQEVLINVGRSILYCDNTKNFDKEIKKSIVKLTQNNFNL